jgi:hypothetical protein
MASAADQGFDRRILAVALATALASATIIALRILALDEALTMRVYRLVAINALGAFLAGLVMMAALLWLQRRLSAGMLTPIAFVVSLPVFLGAFAALFAIHNRFIAGGIASTPFSGDWFFEIVFSPASAVGMFLQTGLKYFLPWPLPLQALAFTTFAFLAFRRA